MRAMTPSVRFLWAGALAVLVLLAPGRGRSEEPPPPGLPAPAMQDAPTGRDERYPELVLAPTTSALAAGARAPGSDLELRLLPLESRSDPVGAALALVPGGSAAEDGPRLRGGSAVDRTTLVDGFRVYNVRPPAGLLARAEVLATGYGVALGHVPGGAVALTTRPSRRLDVGGGFFRQENPRFMPSQWYDGGWYVADETTDGLAAGFTSPIGERLGIVAAVTRRSSERPGSRDVEGVLPTPQPPTERQLDVGGGLVGRVAEGHEVNLLGLLTTLDEKHGAALLAATPNNAPARGGHLAGRGVCRRGKGQRSGWGPRRSGGRSSRGSRPWCRRRRR